MYLMRAFGGLLYLSGAILMAYNIWMTIAGYQREEAPMDDTPHNEAADRPIVQQPQAQPAE
jgi:cytochrome c oxidase cbb3-type subunit 1